MKLSALATIAGLALSATLMSVPATADVLPGVEASAVPVITAPANAVLPALPEVTVTVSPIIPEALPATLTDAPVELAPTLPLPVAVELPEVAVRPELPTLPVLPEVAPVDLDALLTSQCPTTVDMAVIRWCDHHGIAVPEQLMSSLYGPELWDTRSSEQAAEQEARQPAPELFAVAPELAPVQDAHPNLYMLDTPCPPNTTRLEDYTCAGPEFFTN